MAVCQYCNREMLIAKSCVEIPIISKGIHHKPIPYGMEVRSFVNAEERCPDCNVAIGGLHHSGCDMEE
jgi:hypothetical protein